MEPINIEGTEDKPNIILNADREHFEITGRSFPENAIDFYWPIIDWLNEYSKNPNPTTHFVLKFEYYNTATVKQIFKILSILENLAKSNKVTISWYYKGEDMDMLRSGQEFSELISCIELIRY